MKETVLHTAIAASLASGLSLPVDECPIPSFTDLAASLHDAICGISQDSLSRDAALLVEHQKLVKTVAAIDADSAAKTIADIREFISAIDKDGNGAIDGLSAVIEATNNLAPRTTELERRASLTDQAINTINQRTQTLSEADVQIRKEIEELKLREDDAGTSEERVYEIAAGLVCDQVLKPLKAAASALNSSIQALDCGKADTAAFLAAVSGGTDFTPTPNGGGSSLSAEAVSVDSSTTASASTETIASDGVASDVVADAEPEAGTDGALGGR